MRGWAWIRWINSPRDLMPCCSISLLRRLETRYCLFSPSKMPQAFSRKTRNCSKSKLPVDKGTASQNHMNYQERRSWLANICRLDPVDHPGCQIIGPEFGQEIIGTDLLDHGLVEYPRQRSMQDDVKLLHARIVANFRGQRIAIHFRHLDVRSEEHTSELQSHSDLV